MTLKASKFLEIKEQNVLFPIIIDRKLLSSEVRSAKIVYSWFFLQNRFLFSFHIFSKMKEFTQLTISQKTINSSFRCLGGLNVFEYILYPSNRVKTRQGLPPLSATPPPPEMAVFTPSPLLGIRSTDTPTNVGTTNVGNDKHRNDKRRKI